jgi:hypothetical protein
MHRPIALGSRASASTTASATPRKSAEEVWIDGRYTSCEELPREGEAAVVLVDRREA